MNKNIVALLFLLLIAAGACKGPVRLMRRQEHSATQQQLYHSADSLSLNRKSFVVAERGESGMIETEFSPVGTFRYCPDSGFVGTAAKVKVRKQYLRREQQRDSSSLHLSGNNSTIATAKSNTEDFIKERSVTLPAWRSFLPAFLVLCIAAVVLWW